LPAYRYKHESITLKFHLDVRRKRTGCNRDQINATSALSSIANR